MRVTRKSTLSARTRPGRWCRCRKVGRQLAVGGYSESRKTKLERSNGSRRDWWPRDSRKNTASTTIEGCRVLVLRTSNRSAQTGSIRTHADYATTDYATVDYATCGYKIVGTRWASTWRSLIG
ncbi:unnamed protein product [Phytophthora lilii]|uniref:Unnamed protein product n=1 Tax=Phytophthora lilii TaxID=2077276 RepID=A0A9W7D005_9STRA|nr:unnamed protein product [Phytophthora lilii]